MNGNANLAMENNVLNGIGMLFMKLLTNIAQMFENVKIL